MKNPIQEWGDKINWSKRVKAVCKPCWEIKYCPYGPLVEDSPIKEKRDYKSCRIFGHDCPVFYFAEPMTETKELRNISRTIPRKVQFRVLKRDNQICSICGNSVKDEDIEFDHIIPWSKGGSSDEYNVKLLCIKCNRKKGNRFEKEHLVDNFYDHIRQGVPYEFVESIFALAGLIWESIDVNNEELTAEMFCKLWGRRKVKDSDEMGVEMFNDIKQFFNSESPKELKKEDYFALKFRWGFVTKKFQTLKETSTHTKISIEELYALDFMFIERLGFYIKIDESEKKKWIKT